ncbi:MAG: GrpB family protein, partial [Mycobacteriales bacterium]
MITPQPEEPMAWPAWATEGVEIVDYDPAWAEDGARECAHLRQLLEPWLTGGVEHIGSTAVPGLAAKPILDLQAPIKDLAVADAVAGALTLRHWHYVPP